MLKETLSGIKQNIISLVEKEVNPVNQDDIAVFVIFDGIEKVDKTNVDLFRELEFDAFRVN
jgi:hypothetical protein